MRKKVMAANWKMYKTPDQARDFFRDFLPMVQGHTRDEIVVCPTSFLNRRRAGRRQGIECSGRRPERPLERRRRLYRRELRGQLVASGVTHVIIGHSERRQYFGETDDTVNLR